METGVLAGLDVPKAVQGLLSFKKLMGDGPKVDSWGKDENDDEHQKIVLNSISKSNFEDESIFVAEGEIHHEYTLPMRIVSDEFKELDASYSQLLKLVGEENKSIVDFVEQARKKTKNLLDTLCPLQITGIGRRAIFTVLVIGLI